MSRDPSDALRRGYARLTALRDAVKDLRLSQIGGEYVREYHDALSALSGTGISVEEFKIRDDDIRHVPTGGYIRSALQRDRSDSYVDKAMFMAKVNAVISYFELAQEEPQRQIGFRPQR